MNLLFLSISSTIICTLIALAFKYLSLLKWISGHAYVLSKRTEPFSILELLDLFKNVRPFPISCQKGWKIDSYANGHRIWFNFLTFPHNTNAPSIKVFAVFGRIQSSCQALLQVLKDTTQACEWKPGVISSSHTHIRTSYESSITSRGLPSLPVQVDCVKEEKLAFRRQSKFSLLLYDSWNSENVIPTNTIEYKRFWHREDNGVCWLLQMSEELQTCEFFLIQPVQELDQCLVSVITWSHSHSVESYQWGSVLLSALEEYVCLRRLQKTPLTTITLPQDFSESQGDSSDDNQRHESFSQDLYFGKTKHSSLERNRKLNMNSSEWSKSHNNLADVKKKYSSILRYKSTSVKSSTGLPLNSASDSDFKDFGPLAVDPNANTTKPARAALVRSISDGAALKQSREMNRDVERDSFGSIDEENTDNEEENAAGDGNNSSQNVPPDIISEEDIELARYQTISNQCAADLMAEALRASNINLDLTPEKQAETSGGWTFSSFEKNIVILKKVHTGQSTVQSYIGKGFVLAPPKTVWDAVRNPRTRFTYDDTLKKVDIIDKIDSSLKIVYLYHESVQFLAKECYDLSVLQGERQEGEKFVLTYSSIETPKCPSSPNATRAKFLPSGWIIEPARQDNKVYSIITYLMQLDFGPCRENSDKLPFQDMVSRHPLSIDELQKYLRPAVQLLRRKSMSNAQV